MNNKQQQPIEQVLKNIFEHENSDDDIKTGVAAVYSYIKKLRRKINNQAREINRLTEKLNEQRRS